MTKSLRYHEQLNAQEVVGTYLKISENFAFC